MIVNVVGGEARHHLYNLGSGTGHSVGEVFESLRRVTGVDFKTVIHPTPATFVDRVILDTRRFSDDFGAVSLTSLDDGVRATFDDMRTEPL